MPIQLKHELTMVEAGPSKSGKTKFVKKLIENIHTHPEQIIWCYIYSGWQPAYQSLQDRVKFIKDIQEDDETLMADLNNRHLLIFDDMMGRKAIESIVDWFTRIAHHRNTSVIYITQNVFDRAVQHRTSISIIHKTWETNLKLWCWVVNKTCLRMISATRIPHGYLLIDLSPHNPDELRLRSQLFDALSVYMFKI